MTLPPKERTVVRDLAKQVAEMAHEPRMDAIRKRWKDVRTLQKPDRAPAWCNPVGCWPELVPEDVLVCTDPGLRGLEQGFRQTLFKRDVDDDTEVSTRWHVVASFGWEPKNLYGVNMGWHDSGVEGGAWAYAPPPEDRAGFRQARNSRPKI